MALGPSGQPFRSLLIFSVVAALTGVACGGGGSQVGEGPRAGRRPLGAASGPVRVLAASSLTDVFPGLGTAFTAGYGGIGVVFSFSGSSALAHQIEEGAPADVFVSADEIQMARVIASGRASAPRLIARNRLAIVVPEGNPDRITGLADLARRGLVWVACAVEVPCGRLAARALARAGVKATPASQEENVRAVMAKVVLGEADAGIVYATDAATGEKVTGVPIDIAGDPELQATYQMAVLRDARHREAAEAWADFVVSEPGREILGRAGFLVP